jgi:hypothetical protein
LRDKLKNNDLKDFEEDPKEEKANDKRILDYALYMEK